MTRILKSLSRLGRGARYIASALVVAAGLFYLMQPPRTTSNFFDGEWPPMVWGAVMVAAGFVIAWGLQSRVLQIEQYGMLMMGFGAGLLAAGQTLVMFGEPITWTRGGGTLILWALVAFASARYFELSAEIRSARLARARLGG